MNDSELGLVGLIHGGARCCCPIPLECQGRAIAIVSCACGSVRATMAQRAKGTATRRRTLPAARCDAQPTAAPTETTASASAIATCNCGGRRWRMSCDGVCDRVTSSVKSEVTKTFRDLGRVAKDEEEDRNSKDGSTATEQPEKNSDSAGSNQSGGWTSS